MPTKETPFGTPESGPAPQSVHNQHPLTSEHRQPTHSTWRFFNREPRARQRSPRSNRTPSSGSSSDETLRKSIAQSWPRSLNNADFERALLEYGSRKSFMWCLFLLCTSPGILNGFHMMVYVFYAHTPRHWCSITPLENAKWTPEQIRNVSSPRPEEWSNCEYYDTDYEKLRQMGYQQAIQYVKRGGTIRKCENFSYEMKQEGTTIVREWDLVCNRLALKATVQTAVGFGKLIGAFVFGTLSDRFGRKVSFTVASFIYIVAGPVVAVTSFYHVMVIARVFIGIAGLGVYESAYSIVTEICPSEQRPIFGVLYNQSYPIGLMGIALIAYYVKDWRKLQLCISLPALLLAFHVWVIPESPRWLYYSGRKRRAWMAVGQFFPANDVVQEPAGTSWTAPHFMTRLRLTLKEYKNYLKNVEFRRRLFICWVIWCSTSMSYYALSINADHLQVDPHLYVCLSGVLEMASYFIATHFIRIYGRRFTSASMLMTAAIATLSLLFLPSNMMVCKLLAALLGRLCVSGVFCVIIVHACELFPTTMRNSAIGSSATYAHFGSTLAPYLVDFFVIYGWWLPNTVLGIALVIAALLAQILPETSGLALYNTLEDFSMRSESNPMEQVSFRNCLLSIMFKKCMNYRNTLERTPST